MRGISRIRIPAIRATKGWIKTTSRFMEKSPRFRHPRRGTEGDHDMTEILSGGCLCGEIRYRISAAPVEALYCHCRMCQRAHGAPVIAWLTVPLAAFEVSAGIPAA